jgi:hypothetical protein
MKPERYLIPDKEGLVSTYGQIINYQKQVKENIQSFKICECYDNGREWECEESDTE